MKAQFERIWRDAAALRLRARTFFCSSAKKMDQCRVPGTLIDAGATGPRISDAHLAALAMEHGATFYTNDRDFRAFRELDVRFPLHDV